jgi:hypothetical protein
MAKQRLRASPPRCPHRCPVCSLLEAQEAVQEGLVACVPEEVRGHLTRAARELLLALRACVEKGLEPVLEGPRPGSRRRPQKVRLE